jgi:hypothetical protein
MKSFLTFIALSIGMAGFGQYSTAIGLRAGETSGLTVKEFISGPAALEGILGVWHRGFSATLLYERYAPVLIGEGFSWYYGAGGHVAFETYRRGYGWYDYGQRRFYYRDDGVGLGIDGVIGLEYKIPSAPVAFSLDMKPFLEFNTNGGAWVSLDPGLGVKVAF